VVALHPGTARERGLIEGRPVRMVSAAGSVVARLVCDPTLPPGRVALAAGPVASSLHGKETAQGALAVSVVEPDLTWRGTRVAIREA
jgi:anaerobic selenocysteine-containing dehydrogenase